MLIIDFDEVNIGELFEVCHERARDRVKGSVRLAAPGEVNMSDAICILQPGIASEAIQYQCQSLIPFNIPGSLKEFIQNSTNDIA